MTASHGEHAGRPDDGEMSPALRAMVDELRAEAPPAIAWDGMERRLLDRIGRGEGARKGKAERPAWTELPGLAAAAAMLALFVSAGGTSPEKPMEQTRPARIADARAVAPPRSSSGDRDLAALEPGDAVEAGDGSISFARRGDVRFTLAAGSRAVLEASGPRRTVVKLERGAIRAEVEPRDPAEGIVEAFVVETGGTRVAVRGTAFSVARFEDRVDVDVEHGTVAVGPAGREGVLVTASLVGPARAAFSLNGVRLATLPTDASALFNDGAPRPPGEPIPNAVEPHAPPAAHHLPAPVSVPESAPAPAPVPAPVPAPAPVSASESESAPAPAPEPAPEPAPASFLTPASIKAGVERCWSQIYGARQSQLKLSISSTMRIQVRADGTVQSAVFDPPLAPSLQLCAGSVIAGRFTTGARTIAIPMSFGR